jgi:hypothetical protein
MWQDPVHDFGFFRFKPADLKYLKVTEIPLDPDGKGARPLCAAPSHWLLYAALSHLVH